MTETNVESRSHPFDISNFKNRDSVIRFLGGGDPRVVFTRVQDCVTCRYANADQVERSVGKLLRSAVPFETLRTICRRNVVKARRIVSAMDLRTLAIRRAAHTRTVGRAVMALPGPANCATGPFAAALSGMRFQ